eukprot:scaffold8631_cov28-Tisochrysis_lutea.AAC.3
MSRPDVGAERVGAFHECLTAEAREVGANGLNCTTSSCIVRARRPGSTLSPRAHGMWEGREEEGDTFWSGEAAESGGARHARETQPHASSSDGNLQVHTNHKRIHHSRSAGKWAGWHRAKALRTRSNYIDSWRGVAAVHGCARRPMQGRFSVVAARARPSADEGSG